MDVVVSTPLKEFDTSYGSFNVLSEILLRAAKHTGCRIILSLTRAERMPANLIAVLASLNFLLLKSKNQLVVRFGYCDQVVSDLDSDQAARFEGRYCWKGISSYKKLGHPWSFEQYIRQEIFEIQQLILFRSRTLAELSERLLELLKTIGAHSERENSIFIGRSMIRPFLKFTVIDDGQGFMNGVSQNVNKELKEKIANDADAIFWALKGKGQLGGGFLKTFSDWCIANRGSILIVSGSHAISVESEGVDKIQELGGAFRGSIINFSIRI